MLSDYNCRIFDFSKFDIFDNTDEGDSLSIALEKAHNDLVALSKLGFHTFYCPVRYNDNFPVIHTKRIIKDLRESSRRAIPRNCGKISVTFVPKINLSADTPYIKNIASLCVKNTNYIFVELPLDANPGYLPETLNKFLYQCRLKPIFLDFHLYQKIYAQVEIEKMIRIKGAAFQFNLKTAHDPQNIKIIKKILKNGNFVLLGIGCDHSNLNINDISASLTRLKNELGDKTFLEIVISSKKFLS